MKVSDYNYPREVICLGSEEQAKAAALYFDKIIPLLFSKCPDSICPEFFMKDTKLREFFRDRHLDLITHMHLSDRAMSKVESKVFDDFQKGDISTYLSLYILKEKLTFPTEEAIPDFDAHMADLFINDNGGFRSSLGEHLTRNGIHHPPVLAPNSHLTMEAATLEDLTITLADIPLISLENTPWEQIIQLREDKNSANKLRRLRLYLFDNFVGKSKQYMEDRLVSAIEEYEAASKTHGFQLGADTLTMVLSSKSLLGSAVTALTAATLGSVPITTAALVTGLSVEIGKISILIAKKKHAFNKLSEEHPLAYIINARKKLK